MADDIHQWITQHVKKGHHPEELKKTLKKHGHPHEKVEEYFDHPEVHLALKEHEREQRKKVSLESSKDTTGDAPAAKLTYGQRWKMMFETPSDYQDIVLAEDSSAVKRFFYQTTIPVTGVLGILLAFYVFMLLSATGSMTPIGSVLVIIGIPVASVLLFIVSGMLHVVGWVLGLKLALRILVGKVPYKTLSKVSWAALTPTILGLIPFIGLLTAIWWAILLIVGVRQATGCSTGRSIGAFFLSFLFLMIAIMVIIVLPMIVVIWSFFPIPPTMAGAGGAPFVAS